MCGPNEEIKNSVSVNPRQYMLKCHKIKCSMSNIKRQTYVYMSFNSHHRGTERGTKDYQELKKL